MMNIEYYNLLKEGRDIFKENIISPFIGKRADFKVYVVSDKLGEEIKYFGKVRDLG